MAKSNAPTSSHPLRIGLDLDGVILYNPARAARPVVVALKKILAKKKVDKFYIPKKSVNRYLWYLVHKSSLFVSPGFKQLRKIAKEHDVELYVVSGRYSFLKEDLEKWVKKIGGRSAFTSWHNNVDNEQPYLFKERMIRALKLDVFVEDNWDIVKYLAPRNARTKILWVSNVLDARIPYPLKFFSLSGATSYIEKKIVAR